MFIYSISASFFSRNKLLEVCEIERMRISFGIVNLKQFLLFLLHFDIQSHNYTNYFSQIFEIPSKFKKMLSKDTKLKYPRSNCKIPFFVKKKK